MSQSSTDRYTIAPLAKVILALVTQADLDTISKGSYLICDPETKNYYNAHIRCIKGKCNFSVVGLTNQVFHV